MVKGHRREKEGGKKVSFSPNESRPPFFPFYELFPATSGLSVSRGFLLSLSLWPSLLTLALLDGERDEAPKVERGKKLG